MNEQGMIRIGRTDVNQVWLLLAFALAIRLVWIVVGPQLIENEGGYFARVAENILSGRGFISPYGEVDTMYTLGYSIMIAIVSFFVHNAELSGRLISAGAGTATVIAVYAIAKHIYGPRAGVLSGLLAAVSPLLVGYAGAVYSETPYMGFVMGGVYFGLRAIEFKKYRHGALAGMCFGIAYLTRPEGVAYLGLVIVAVGVAAVVQRAGWRKAITMSGAIALAGALFVLPNMGYFWKVTGQARLEGKNNVNFVIIKRMEAGMNYNEASWAIDDDLNEVGPLLNPVPFATHSPYPVTAGELLAGLPQRVVHNFGQIVEHFLPSYSYGSPVLLLLVILGLFGRSWDRARLGKEMFFGLMASWAIAISLLAHIIWFRYTLPMFPYLLVWAGNGARELGEWGAQTAGAVAVRSRVQREVIERWGWRGTMGVIFVGFITFGWMGAKYIAEVTQGFNEHRILKEAGLWLRAHDPGPKMVMDVSTQVSFYGNGDFGGLPYASSDLALKYLEQRKKPNYIVVWSGSVEKRPYLADWLKNGIPSPHAELIHRVERDDGNVVVLYRWKS